MIDVNQLRRGVTFTQDGELYKVTEYSHNKPGRGSATIRVNVRNMRTGSNSQITYSSGDRVQDVRTEKNAPCNISMMTGRFLCSWTRKRLSNRSSITAF